MVVFAIYYPSHKSLGIILASYLWTRLAKGNDTLKVLFEWRFRVTGLPNKSDTALKEWAVTVDALGRGDQIIILRKGGIHKEDKEFRIIHPEFLLFSTYEHQKNELLKPSYHKRLKEIEETKDASEFVEFIYWASVTDKFEIRDESDLEKISERHLWTEAYAVSRFHWRPSQPLTIALVKVFRLEEPIIIESIPQFAGCKSWIDLQPTINLPDMKPVLNDMDYDNEVSIIRESLADSLVTLK